MAKKKVKPTAVSKGKTVRSATKAATKKAKGAPFNEQDPKRRLGNFGGAGEHPLQGGRTSGIVGQTMQKSGTDKGKKK